MNNNENKPNDDITKIGNSLFGEYIEAYNKVISKLNYDELMIRALRKAMIILVKMISINFLITIAIVVAMVILYVKG